MNTHPPETDLALLAGGECSVFARFSLRKHIRTCPQCSERIAEFQTLRELTADLPEPDLNWTSLAAEMRANIHLGLEAGECIRVVSPGRSHIRMAAAFASLMFVIGAGFFMRNPVPVQAATVLESSRSGLEVRSQAGSLTLLNRHGAVTDQTVSAQGEPIRARYIDADAGTVTINNVYLE